MLCSPLAGAWHTDWCPFSLIGEGITLEHLRLGVHIWVSVLIMGTLWRVLQYHLVASSNTTWQHLGRAMALQY